ncbi:putative DNA topoisomerase 2 [Cocos nucifera]|uniref:DNA topoisomerase (ATP-hydrolyzing) n=1 Tax=Cocos nucifera TaxID=13894 RepID=A0A8K0N7E4_COCNU|nr:putative DNA topoisomerase 2 [Cocos nucifera]
MQSMDPWYRGFKGLIEKSATKEAGVTYIITGLTEEVDNATLRITELLVSRWTQDYKEFLESLMIGNDKIKEPFIKDYREHNDDINVHFEIILTEGVMKKYDTPEQVLEDFFHLRFEFYATRKKVLLDSNLELDLLKLDNKVRFILSVVRGEIIVSNRKRADFFLELQEKGFAPFPKKSKGIDAAIAGATVEEEEDNDGSPEVELCSDRKKVEDEVEELRKSSPRDLWMNDLDAFERELDVSLYSLKDMTDVFHVNGSCGLCTESMLVFAGDAPEASKLKARGGAKKALGKEVMVVESDEDEEVLALKDRLAAYKPRFFSRSICFFAAMETEAVPGQGEHRKKEPSKRKAPSTFTEISDGDDVEDNMPTVPEDDDEDFELVEAPKGGKGEEDEGLSPFNKKSGSVMGRTGISPTDGEESGSSSSRSQVEKNEVPVLVARPKVGGNRTRAVYVESDSEMEDEPETDGSDLEEEEDY